MKTFSPYFYSSHLNNPKPNPLDPVPRFPNLVLPLLSISKIFSTPHIHLFNSNTPLPISAPNLVSKPQDQKDRNSDIANQKVRDIPPAGDKDVEAIGERDENHDDEREIGRVGLERCAEGKGIEHVVEDHGAAETEVGYEDDDPGDEARDGGDVCEPVEDGGAAVAYVEKRETADTEGEEHSYPGNTSFVAAEEDLGGLVCEGERVEHT